LWVFVFADLEVEYVKIRVVGKFDFMDDDDDEH